VGAATPTSYNVASPLLIDMTSLQFCYNINKHVSD
jgi:hypothetical protein